MNTQALPSGKIIMLVFTLAQNNNARLYFSASTAAHVMGRIAVHMSAGRLQGAAAKSHGNVSTMHHVNPTFVLKRWGP